ncbi:hypothetical protein [Streptomyces sp. V2I9]|uniref:hypothetical protein n=1 Tax=Streptomyces sp. V2I9 TaxID=3042304 RepID=UPI0027831C23|nr:hypothetical protein [Streptomyces sp. V2I9]MDQ0982882.1 hypothetical protein [Streptomyces sp. V2I9]
MSTEDLSTAGPAGADGETARVARLTDGLPAAARRVLAETDWDSFRHAYGPAGDTPGHLCSLLDEDPEVRSGALAALDMSVLHQGTLCAVTAPVTLFIAAILDHPLGRAVHEGHFPWDDGPPRSLRAALLAWLAYVATAAAYGEAPVPDRSDWRWAPWDDGTPRERTPEERAALDACRTVRPALYEAVEPHLSSPDPHVCDAAVGAALPLLSAPGLGDRIPRAAALVRARLSTVTDRRARAGMARALAVWRADTSDLLTDPDPAVRVCAALGPDPVDRSRALAVLLGALRDPRTTDGWFTEPLAGLEGWFRFTVLRSALTLAESFEEVAPVALAIVRADGASVVDFECGPILRRAFPDGHAPARPMTAAQRDLLRAFLDTEAADGLGRLVPWLRSVGLPETREGIAALLR